MDEDEETWLSPGLSSTTTSASKGTQSLDSWLNTPSSAIDFSTRSALSRKLKVYSEKKARRKSRALLLSASTISLESVTEEQNLSTSQTSIPDDVTLPAAPPLGPQGPLAHSSPVLERARSLDVPDGPGSFGQPSFDNDDDDEEYKLLEKEALGLSLGGAGPEEPEWPAGEEALKTDRMDTTAEDEEEFLSAASEFEDEELEAAHHNGLAHRSRELESLDEEPARVARQQVLGGARLGIAAPRSSSVSPRLATATVAPQATSTPKAPQALHRLASAEIYSTPVGTATLPRRPGGAGSTATDGKPGGMSVSLHMPSGHLPPRRVPPGRGTVGGAGAGGMENGKSSPAGGGAGRPSPKEAAKKANLHEDLAKIEDLARQQEEALRREVMGSLSANDVSNGENDSRLITNSKSVEFVGGGGGGGGKKEFHSRLPTPSRRVIPVRTTSTTAGGGAGRAGGAPPLRTTTPNSVGAVGAGGGGGASLALSRPASGASCGSVVGGDGDDACF